jgi:hypothetical protein
MVIYTVNCNIIEMRYYLATWEVEIGRITVQGQSREKVSKSLSQQINWCRGTCLKFQLCGRIIVQG